MGWVNLLPRKTVENVSDYLKGIYHKAIEVDDLRLVNSPTVTDEEVKKVVMEICEFFEVETFGYDPWHMREVAEDMEGLGYPMLALS